jgi:hypothetical protein
MKKAILLGCLSFAGWLNATEVGQKAKDDATEDENTYISYDPKRSIK